jgi:putative peptide zinc metalloprotease protein
VEDELMELRDRLRLARSSIVAPFDGVITNLDSRVQDGFQPGEGMIVGELQSSRDLWVHGLVPATDLDKVKDNQDVEIVLPVRTGGPLRAKIDSIKSYSEPDLRNSPFSSRFGGEVATEVRDEKQEEVPIEPQYDCSVRVVNDDGSILLGMTGRMAVLARPRSLAARVLENVIKTFHKESFL